MAGTSIDTGRRVAAWLRGAWREHPPRPALAPGDLEAAAAVLNRSGCAGLGWWAVRETDLASTTIGRALQDAFRLQVLGAAMRDQAVAGLFERLDAASVFAVLGKGWAAAEAYAHRGLRPYGDYDLYVEPADFARAGETVAACAQPVDLHRGLAELADRGWDDVRARVRSRPTDGRDVRIFGAEDHLRLLALHMLRHGAWRPLWLCDIAAAVEAVPRTFDWDYALRGRTAWTSGLRTAIGLARDLLGADVSRLPPSANAAVPPWVVRCVLRQWGTPIVPHGLRAPFAAVTRTPLALARQVRLRWPNAVEATFDLGLGFGRFPVRWPIQVAECAVRGLRFARGVVARRAS